jgi:hypothetical protein
MHVEVAGETLGLQNQSCRIRFSMRAPNFMLNTISANRVNVTVAGQIFSIPADKVQQVMNMLASLQSIQVSETPSPFIQYQGKSLING